MRPISKFISLLDEIVSYKSETEFWNLKIKSVSPKRVVLTVMFGSIFAAFRIVDYVTQL